MNLMRREGAGLGAQLALGAIAGGGVAVGAYHRYNVQNGRVTPGGHHEYETQVDMGLTTEVGEPESTKEMIENEPWEAFPMAAQGGPLRVGSTARLFPFRAVAQFPCLSQTVPFSNEVEVIASDSRSITLAARNHLFKGTARHEWRKVKIDGEWHTFYCIHGCGPTDRTENTLLQNANVFFGDVCWPFLVNHRTIPAARKRKNKKQGN